MPHMEACTTAACPAPKPLDSGYIMMAAKPSRTTNIEVILLDSSRAVSAPRWICMIVA